MPAAAAASGTGGFREGQSSRRDPNSLQIYFLVAGSLVFSAIVAATALQWTSIRPFLPTIVIWAGVVAIADLLPVQLWGEVSFSMSLPVTLSAGMLLGPLPAALISILGSVDPREVKRETTLRRSIYNRGQVAASVWTASIVFHGFHVPVSAWPLVLLPTAAALATDFLVNMTFVAIPVGMRMQVPATAVLRRLFAEAPFEYLAGYVSLGLVAVLQATVVDAAGLWGLIASLAPLGLARKMFVQTNQLGLAASKLEIKDIALLDATRHISEERRDERMALAGELHDEVLPPLFKVHLMGQVLRQDLISGRLLDLDEDLPALLTATEVAQTAIRTLLGDLRRSPIGVGGLASTIRLLAQELESDGSPPIVLDLNEVGGSHLSQLLLFQVAREAMTNAARYSRANQIQVRLWEDEGLRLVVSDDGVGFEISIIDPTKHFGFQLIAERVEAAYGSAIIDSRPGLGTTVVVVLPLEADG